MIEDGTLSDGTVYLCSCHFCSLYIYVYDTVLSKSIIQGHSMSFLFRSNINPISVYNIFNCVQSHEQRGVHVK